MKVFRINKTFFTTVFLLYNIVIIAQEQYKNKNTYHMKEMLKFENRIQIKLNEKVCFEDSLIILLSSFTHKRPRVGGSTHATANFFVSKDNVSEELRLSIHGIEGKSGITRYDTIEWNNYRFELKQFNYDSDIELIVYKK